MKNKRNACACCLLLTAACLRPPLQVYYKVLHISGHYNTQLGTLAALGLDTLPAAANLTWLK